MLPVRLPSGLVRWPLPGPAGRRLAPMSSGVRGPPCPPAPGAPGVARAPGVAWAAGARAGHPGCAGRPLADAGAALRGCGGPGTSRRLMSATARSFVSATAGNGRLAAQARGRRGRGRRAGRGGRRIVGARSVARACRGLVPGDDALAAGRGGVTQRRARAGVTRLSRGALRAGRVGRRTLGGLLRDGLGDVLIHLVLERETRRLRRDQARNAVQDLGEAPDRLRVPRAQQVEPALGAVVNGRGPRRGLVQGLLGLRLGARRARCPPSCVRPPWRGRLPRGPRSWSCPHRRAPWKSPARPAPGRR